MTGPDFIIILATGIATVAMALVAVVQKNLIRAVIAFAISSVSLAILFFMLASPYAAVLELVVGSGLVAVLFLVALILAGGEEEEKVRAGMRKTPVLLSWEPPS
jgi:NADH:ubiquinone oxidoreductase subunit 6 (subunit J)